MEKTRALMIGTALAVLSAPPRPATAQDFDVDVWTGLAQMPVAVARLELAGIPLADLRVLVPALNDPDVPPSEFLRAARGIPVLWGDTDARSGGEEERGVGSFVQAMHARGLRGRELADAIHRELRRRGVPAGPEDRRGGVDVLDPDYIDDEWVDGRFRDDPFFTVEGEDGRARGPRPRVFRDRGRARGHEGGGAVRRGPPDERGGGPPGRADPGKRGRGGKGPPAGRGGGA